MTYIDNGLDHTLFWMYNSDGLIAAVYVKVLKKEKANMWF